MNQTPYISEQSQGVPFLNVFRNTDGSITFIHDGTVWTPRADELYHMKKQLMCDDEDLMASAYIFMSKQHPIAEIVTFHEFLQFIRQTNSKEDADDIEREISS